jgi:hypothetical protein
MSIAPVNNLEPVTAFQSNEGDARPTPAVRTPEKTIPPASVGGESSPATAPAVYGPSEIAQLGTEQDEVQLQRDAEDNNQILVRYVDQKTGDLVLQIPSNQVLSVARGIYEEMQQEARARNSAGISGRDEGLENGH